MARKIEDLGGGWYQVGGARGEKVQGLKAAAKAAGYPSEDAARKHVVQPEAAADTAYDGDLVDAKADQIVAIRAALAGLKDPYAVNFFLGVHGLGSADRAARLEAAKVHAEAGETGMLYGIVQYLNTEKDEEVRKAMIAALEAIQARGR